MYVFKIREIFHIKQISEEIGLYLQLCPLVQIESFAPIFEVLPIWLCTFVCVIISASERSLLSSIFLLNMFEINQVMSQFSDTTFLHIITPLTLVQKGSMDLYSDGEDATFCIQLCKLTNIPAPIAQLVKSLLRGTGGHGFDPGPQHTSR